MAAATLTHKTFHSSQCNKTPYILKTTDTRQANTKSTHYRRYLWYIIRRISSRGFNGRQQSRVFLPSKPCSEQHHKRTNVK